MSRVLEIFVMSNCFGSDTAIRLAKQIRTRVPEIDVQVVDLSEPETVRPPAVFAVPTYLLDGSVLSLGNPDEDWLLARIESEAPHRAEENR